MRFEPFCMLFSSPALAAFRIAGAVALVSSLAACSQSTRLDGKPSWSLTGGKEVMPPPPAARPQAPIAPQIAAAQRSDRVETVPLQPIAPANATPGAAAPAAPPARVAALNPSDRHYGRPVVEVQPGDSLASIAKAHRVSIASLMFTNSLRDAYVTPGQRLVIPSR